VKDADGKGLLEASPKTKEVLDPAVAYLATDMLKGVIKRGTGRSAEIGRPAAGKTGTTQQYRDAWFVGYTPDLVTAVWVGYPEAQREMTSVHGRNVTGGSLPADIWARFMKAALADTEPTAFERPEGLKKIRVCTESGGRATEYCPKTASALSLARFKAEPCEIHTTPIEVVVPSVVGLPKAEALSVIEKAQLKAKVVEQPVNGVEAGVVATQDPPEGTKIEPDATVTIVVASGAGVNKPPIAAFDGPSAGKSGEKLTFDAGTSTDDGSILQYYWEFGDGATTSGRRVKHSWASPGSYELTLWVTDDRGAQASITRQIIIR
jgi:membrane peptidoglycan carboxypeptidase